MPVIAAMLLTGCEGAPDNLVAPGAEPDRSAATLLQAAYGDQALRQILSRADDRGIAPEPGGFRDLWQRGEIRHVAKGQYEKLSSGSGGIAVEASGNPYQLYPTNNVWVDEEGSLVVKFDAATWVNPTPLQVVTDGQYVVSGSMYCVSGDELVVALAPENFAAYTRTYQINEFCGPTEAGQSVIHAGEVALEDQQWMTVPTHVTVPISNSGGDLDSVDP